MEHTPNHKSDYRQLTVNATRISKKFAHERIFKEITFQADKYHPIAFVGHNGSGKSTLLKITAGLMPISEGKLTYVRGKAQISPDYIFRMLSLATPYQQLPEEFTLPEILDFHEKFKPFLLEKAQIIDKLQFAKAQTKPIKYYSSGMKQKLKLALALFSKAQMLLLDEPTANFDKTNTNWYLTEIEQFVGKKVILIASNQAHEYYFCKQTVLLGKH